MSKICVLIRVYNRIEDLKYCVDIVRDSWNSNLYYIIVIANGKKDGYVITDEIISKIDKLIEIQNNVGHFGGNSQLLLAGLPYIPSECKYTLILEADTWMYGDEIIKKYVKKLEKEKAVWASAKFFRYVKNLATDFAIVDTTFIKAHKEIFVFTGTPEYDVANYLSQNGYKFIYINENMPVNLPRYVKRYPYAPTGRFFLFEKSKMVTHHIEVLPGGMEQKKRDFNTVSRTHYFKLAKKGPILLNLIGLQLSKLVSTLLPYKGWFVRVKKINI